MAEKSQILHSLVDNNDAEKTQHYDSSDHDGSWKSSHDGDRDDAAHDLETLTQPITHQETRTSNRRSGDLRRNASNVLTAVASRMSTRGWPDPGPPPDGGMKAWTQVACGW
ncbi:hypothetical protein BD289DRAFT_234345 [Coniella lustricola]|uniref:Uncharacterized protein n=1 Tax=Coniella lustricola TaxID=2025994 RepID=A0A2T3A9S2_9PEZI|nr:hypothetical protein BD289DRAFT_234345 [Coniella lustricola]